MSVTREYFVRDDDEQGAALLDSTDEGVLGMCPITELVSLEALLLGLSPLQESTLELMQRPDHDVSVAQDDEDAPDVVVSKIADHTAALIAGATADELAAAMEPWSQTEEFAGYVTAAELAEVMGQLQPLFRRAVAEGRHVYVRNSC